VIVSLCRIDELAKVYDEEAIGMAKSLTRGKRWFAGISSLANTVGRLEIAKSWEMKELSLQLYLITHADRYHSTLFRDGFV